MVKRDIESGSVIFIGINFPCMKETTAVMPRHAMET